MRALDRQADTAIAEAAQARAHGRPNIGIWLGYQREDTAGIVLAGLRMSLPIWNRARGERATAAAREQRARETRDATVHVATRQIADAVAAYQASERAVATFEREVVPILADSERLLDKTLGAGQIPAGYFLDVGGKVESQVRAQSALYLAVALALLCVFLLLYLALGSLAETVVILATLPSAFVGGIVALVIARESWSVSSLVGLVGLFGIAVQNGLVLVTQTRGLVTDGLPFNEALREACIGRVRPKVMTAATAILGLLPLLVLGLHGTEIERPLAIVMVGGLVTSTIFTLLALPTFYQLVHNVGVRWTDRRGAPS